VNYQNPVLKLPVPVQLPWYQIVQPPASETEYNYIPNSAKCCISAQFEIIQRYMAIFYSTEGEMA
jgi:hypothetical protein